MPLNENDEEEEEDMLGISLHSLSRSIHRSVNNLMEEETRIDHASSRNLAQGEKPSSRQSVICEKNMLIYAASCFFFHLGNCAILPLVSAGDFLLLRHKFSYFGASKPALSSFLK